MAREYELVLMLDPGAVDERRDQVADETRKRIESGGALKHAETWGNRKLAYEIRQRTEADYRFYRFEAERELLDGLDHALKIADGVLRFRIFKVDGTTPTIAPPPTAQPAGVGARVARAERRAEEAAPRESAEDESAEAAPAEAAAAEPQTAEPEAAAPETAAPEQPTPPSEAPEPEDAGEASDEQPG